MQAEVTGFVGDGYEVPRYIKAKPGLYPAVRLTVRIVEPTERGRWTHELGRVDADDPAGRTMVTARWLAERITEWDLGRKVAAESVAKLTPALFDRMFAIVFGDEAGDPLPETGKKPPHDREGDAGN